jgi:hypothetical protein
MYSKVATLSEHALGLISRLVIVRSTENIADNPGG